jgi:hypothetical protein
VGVGEEGRRESTCRQGGGQGQKGVCTAIPGPPQRWGWGCIGTSRAVSNWSCSVAGAITGPSYPWIQCKVACSMLESRTFVMVESR